MRIDLESLSISVSQNGLIATDETNFTMMHSSIEDLRASLGDIIINSMVEGHLRYNELLGNRITRFIFGLDYYGNTKEIR